MTQGSENEIKEQWAVGTDATRTPWRKRPYLALASTPHCSTTTVNLQLYC